MSAKKISFGYVGVGNTANDGNIEITSANLDLDLKAVERVL